MRHVLALMACLAMLTVLAGCGGGGGGSHTPQGLIAFVSSRDGSSPEVYTMNWDGSNVTRLTDDSV